MENGQIKKQKQKFEDSQKSRFDIFKHRTRFFMVFLILLCLSSAWCNILTFNIAVLCMHPHRTQNGSLTELEIELAQKNNTMPHSPDDPHVIGFFLKQIIWYTPNDKSKLIAAVAVGALVANFPIVWLTSRYQIRTTFGILGLLSAIATMLIPTAARLGIKYFLVIRAIQGVSFAANFCVIGSFTNKWTYFKQNGMFVSALVAHFQLAPAIAMPVGGYLCSAYGWPSVYYAHGLVSFFLFAAIIVIYRNSPNKHPFVTNVELKKIAVGKANVSKIEQRQVPYRSILKTWAVWAIWVAAFGNFLCANLMFLYSPTFLHVVLGFHVEHTGITSAIPPLLQFAAKLTCGVASDKIRNINESLKLKIFNSIAFFGSAACLIGLSIAAPDYGFISICFLGASIGFLGLTTGGFFKSGPLIARHYAPFVTGNISLGITITMLLVPFMVFILAPDNTPAQWKKVFLLTAAILVITNIFFITFGSATMSSWVIPQSTAASQSNSTSFSFGTKRIASSSENQLTPEMKQHQPQWVNEKF